METEMASCALRVTDKTLAAWRDETLGIEEALQLSGHVIICVVCRSRIASFDQIDSAIRSQPVPSPASSRLWAELQAGMSSTRRARHSRGNAAGYLRGKQLLGSLGAVAAAILIIVGFVRLLQTQAGVQGLTTARLLASPTPLPTLGPAPVPVAGASLRWHNYAVPPQFLLPESTLNLAVSATDGATAYVCDPVVLPVTLPGGLGPQHPQIWATHDLGATWKHVGDLPTLGQVSWCSLDVDVTDGRRIVADLEGQNAAQTDLEEWLLSENGGVTWTRLGIYMAGTLDSSTQIEQIATEQGKTYGIYSTTSYIFDPFLSRSSAYHIVQETHLGVSTDGLRTWSAVDEPILAAVGAHHQVLQFWAQPGPGGQVSLLADVTYNPTITPPSNMPPPSQPETLWISQDGGQNWTQLPSPELESYIAAASPTGHFWYICGSTSDAVQESGQSPVTACSGDSGRTWTARPALRACNSCTGQVMVFGDAYIAGDGSLVGLFEYKNTDVSALYRLPPKSSQWQFLSLVPTGDNGFIYAPSASSPAGSGYFWVYEGGTGGYEYDLSAITGGDAYSTGALATAAYSF
jgi:hypothetical protein